MRDNEWKMIKEKVELNSFVADKLGDYEEEAVRDMKKSFTCTFEWIVCPVL